MFGVVGLHVFGTLEPVLCSDLGKVFLRILYTVLYCSVNLFALLSGYLYYGRKTKTKSIVSIWMATLFWGMCIALLAICLNYSTLKGVLSIFIPFISGRLWYITDYTFVFFMIPFMNRLIDSLENKETYRLLILLFLMLSVGSTFLIRDRLGIVGVGYSAVWLCFNYLIGGAINKYGFGYLTPQKTVLVILINSGIMIMSSYFVDAMGFSENYILYRYASPFIVINSVLIFNFVNNCIHITGNKIKRLLSWTSSVSLGVYIIHANPFFLDNIITADNLELLFGSNNEVCKIGGGIITVCLIFLMCGVLENIRKYIFDLIGIKKMEEEVSGFIDKMMDFMVRKLLN